MKEALLNGMKLFIYSADEVATLLLTGVVAGKPISAIGLLRNAFENFLVFPGLLIGLWENPRNSNIWLFSYLILWNSKIYRVHIELHMCENCKSKLIGCSVRDYDLYLDSSSPETELEAARNLPVARCPHCANELSRKYLAIFDIGGGTLHLASYR